MGEGTFGVVHKAVWREAVVIINIPSGTEPHRRRKRGGFGAEAPPQNLGSQARVTRSIYNALKCRILGSMYVLLGHNARARFLQENG